MHDDSNSCALLLSSPSASRRTQSVAWNRETVGAFDAVVIATAHRAVNYAELGAWAQCIIDTRNAMVAISAPPGLVWKA